MGMASFLAQLKQFSVVRRSGYDVVQDSGQKIEFAETRELVLLRPDRFREEVRRSDGEVSTVVFDGKAVTVLNATKKMYASSEMEGNIDDAITHWVKERKMRLPLAMLFVTSLPEEIEKRVQEVETVETAMLGDDSYSHLAARADTVDFQVWIPTTGDPLPSRIVITYKHEEGQPQYWANFSDWNLSPDPPTSLFSLELPKDAGRIPFLADVSQAPTAPAAKGEDK